MGEEIITIPTRLIRASKGNIAIAQTAVAVLDEFDKLAGVGGNRSRFNGEGSTKDIHAACELNY